MALKKFEHTASQEYAFLFQKISNRWIIKENWDIKLLLSDKNSFFFQDIWKSDCRFENKNKNGKPAVGS